MPVAFDNRTTSPTHSHVSAVNTPPPLDPGAPMQVVCRCLCLHQGTLRLLWQIIPSVTMFTSPNGLPTAYTSRPIFGVCDTNYAELISLEIPSTSSMIAASSSSLLATSFPFHPCVRTSESDGVNDTIIDPHPWVFSSRTT